MNETSYERKCRWCERRFDGEPREAFINYVWHVSNEHPEHADTTFLAALEATAHPVAESRPCSDWPECSHKDEHDV